MQLDIARKLSLYLRAAAASRSFNWPGFPLWPKTRTAPSCRGNYNTFVLWLKQLGFKKAAVIFDVGANHGDFAKAASAVYPESEVWLFEPQPALIPMLSELAKHRHSRWLVEPIGLGNVDGTLPLEVAADDAIASFVGFSQRYREANPGGKAIQSVAIEVQRLDTYCNRSNISSIDVLKIDVEGYEFEVLAGAENMLRSTAAIIIEVSLIRETKQQGDALAQMISLLSQIGFTIIDVIPSLFSPEKPWQPVEYNVLARQTGCCDPCSD